jgi:hypothetical protein
MCCVWYIYIFNNFEGVLWELYIFYVYRIVSGYVVGVALRKHAFLNLRILLPKNNLIGLGS